MENAPHNYKELVTNNIEMLLAMSVQLMDKESGSNEPSLRAVRDLVGPTDSILHAKSLQCANSRCLVWRVKTA